MLILPNLISEPSASVKKSSPTIKSNDTDITPILHLSPQTLAVNAPTTPEKRTKTPLIDEIKAELALYDWNTETMLKIAFCESSYNIYAFNPETYAKEKGLTKFSSCGFLQINSAECEKDDSPLYDLKYNIAQAYKKFKTQNYNAWKNCYNKLTK